MRQIIKVTGSDRLAFLNGLMTQDVPSDGLAYGALQTPQGKYLADFFMFQNTEAIFLDVDAELAPDLVKRLSMYRLRSDVVIEFSSLLVLTGRGAAPKGARMDPRDESLGWRMYTKGRPLGEGVPLETAYDALLIEKGIPQSGADLIVDESYILEMGFERLGGVSFQKGCFVGQEIVARMKHKTELRKGLATVRLSNVVNVGTEVTSEGKSVGRIGSVATTDEGAIALAYLRYDRAQGDMDAGGARVELVTRWV